MVGPPDDTDAVCQQVEEVARRTYQRGLWAGFHDNAETRERLVLQARHGWLRVLLLTVAGRPGGFWLGTVAGDTFHARATGYVPELGRFEVGTALTLRLIAELVREGVTRVDWGAGDIAYKRRFGTRAGREARAELFGRTRRSRWLRGDKAAGDALGRWARQLAARARLLNRIKQTWRRRLAGG